MEIKKVEKDKYSSEAEIVLENDKVSFKCFCPNINEIKDKSIVKLHAFLIKDIKKSMTTNFMLKKICNSYYGYEICGLLKGKKIIKFFDLDINLDEDVPGDIEIGDFLTFVVTRLDIL